MDNPGITAKIIKDSLAPTGDRLTTFQLRVPKWLLAEINTHRALSRNAASSRAVPAKEARRRVLQDPFIPAYLGKNQKGMQAENELTPVRKSLALAVWRMSRYGALASHFLLEALSLHKQLTNRLLEPWAWADVVISGTEWKNFYHLRFNAAAQPEFQDVAGKMSLAYSESVPVPLEKGEWHLPYVELKDLEFLGLENAKKVSAARCARVSLYLTDKKSASPLDKDKDMCERLLTDMHLSPFEHVAYVSPGRHGNFVGFRAWRKDIMNENHGDYEGYSYATRENEERNSEDRRQRSSAEKSKKVS